MWQSRLRTLYITLPLFRIFRLLGWFYFNRLLHKTEYKYFVSPFFETTPYTVSLYNIEITKTYTKNYNSVKFKKVPRKIFYIVKSLFVWYNLQCINIIISRPVRRGLWEDMSWLNILSYIYISSHFWFICLGGIKGCKKARCQSGNLHACLRQRKNKYKKNA